MAPAARRAGVDGVHVPFRGGAARRLAGRRRSGRTRRRAQRDRYRSGATCPTSRPCAPLCARATESGRRQMAIPRLVAAFRG